MPGKSIHSCWMGPAGTKPKVESNKDWSKEYVVRQVEK